MGKRSNFKRNPRDYYKTPYKAVIPLLPFIEGEYFYEPCAGDGALVDHLKINGLRCAGMSDIEPQHTRVMPLDAFAYKVHKPTTDCIITNPPWDRKILHPMIEHFRNMAPTWLLFDADWMHTKQAIPYLKYCKKIISVGRISWMGNGQVGKDNCAWYLFQDKQCKTEFIGRCE